MVLVEVLVGTGSWEGPWEILAGCVDDFGVLLQRRLKKDGRADGLIDIGLLHLRMCSCPSAILASCAPASAPA